ncbi:NAD(P)/FAD-dependent oxidoreductase [Geomicrobium sediminis]|uniref:Gamma-glutamylputrescine oxidase n=1 Tax=Geomicrobium sediminis TaxID=1347788 RepID=A0ABS2PFP0_9BACL|nr:FAD-binding oxidoreductase [Geomicrobium sediminis]MBM7634166.1 gamma-glutamylputrescine oxidase [Geomicrobium sediminis]
METLSMWEATSTQRLHRTSLDQDVSTDVVIIGAGYTGLSTAYHLQKQGIQTVVLEQSYVGSGASGRNGGEVLTGYHGSMKHWMEKKGEQAAKEMFQLSLDAINLVEQIIREQNIQCDFKRNGDFYAAYKEADLDAMKAEQEVLHKHFDHTVEIVERNELRNELATSFYVGGRVDPKSAHFHPFNYAVGLAKAVEGHGGTIFERTEALAIKRSKQQVVIKTEKGTVTAKELVIATNGYAGPLHKTIQRSVVPVESIMIATEPLPEKLVEKLIVHDRAVADSKNLLYYFRRTADNRLAFGGSGRSSSKRDQKRLFENLHKGMLTVFPQLYDRKIAFEWGGKVAFTTEKLPYIGQLDDGTYYAFGYAGHGAAMSSMLGKQLAEAIYSHTPVSIPLAKRQLQTIPFHQHYQKGISLMKFYYKHQDRR